MFCMVWRTRMTRITCIPIRKGTLMKNHTAANFIKLGPWGARLCSMAQSSGSRDHTKLKHRDDVLHGLTNVFLQIGKMSKMMLPMPNQMQKLQMMWICGA
eukprot:475670-Karenia_brevis.AAC.2